MATNTATVNKLAALNASAASPAALHDRRRSWLWWALAAVALSQLYFVRELLAAYALFIIAFVAVAAVVVTVYMLTKIGQLAMGRFAAVRQPVLTISPTPHDVQKPA